MSKKLKKVDDIEETVDNIEDKTPSREELEAILDERPEDTRKAKKKTVCGGSHRVCRTVGVS